MHLWSRSACAASVIAIIASAANAQPPGDLEIKYYSGQDVVPVFDGWERNADGSFDMVFGYFNRNYREAVIVPVGADNKLEPGPADQGQPTYFYPRLDRFAFRVRVPKDWGTKDLVWALTSHGKTEKTYGSLLPIWEIDRITESALGGAGAAGANGNDENVSKNRPPSVTIQAVQSVVLPHLLNLIASVTDDGLPRPVRVEATQGAVQRAARGRASRPVLPTNVPPVFVPPRPPPGLSVEWIVYRGPAGVMFDPDGFTTVKDGKGIAKATFSEPGTYVLQAVASDGLLRTPASTTVTVAAPASTQLR